MNAPAIINSGAPLPKTYETARTALANCQAIDECKEWADKAAALASYARQADDVELEKMAARIRARAMRRAGELIKQIEPAHGANQNISDGAVNKVITRTDMARQAGMSERQQITAVRVASIPEHDFTSQVEGSNPPTLTELARQGTQKRDIPPSSDTWLKGRDGKTYNGILHMIAAIQEYADECDTWPLDRLLPALNDDERKKIRAAITQIDSIHDVIVTRI